MRATSDPWWDRELAGCTFADARLARRLRTLLGQLSGAIGASLPLACQDWAGTKAAYRFFANDRVDEGQILAGHFAATRERVTATEGPILVVQDTTEFTYQRERARTIGVTCRVNSGRDKAGRVRAHTVCGLLMHASLVVTPEGLPLGLAAEGLVAAEVQGRRRAQAPGQPDPAADRAQGKRSLARQHAPVHGPARCA